MAGGGACSDTGQKFCEDAVVRAEWELREHLHLLQCKSARGIQISDYVSHAGLI